MLYELENLFLEPKIGHALLDPGEFIVQRVLGALSKM